MKLSFFQQLHPLQPYSVHSLQAYLPKNRPQRLVNLLRGELVALIDRECFPPLGDGVKNGHITWLGYRFMATKGTVPRLPIYNRPILAYELLNHFPHLAEKIAYMMTYCIQPPDIHPFIIALHVWQPSSKAKCRRVKYLGPPEIHRARSGAQCVRKGVLLKWR